MDIKVNNSPENISLMMRRRNELLKRQTKAEIHIGKLLLKCKIRFTAQKCFAIEKAFFIVDFYLPAPARLCIELDGKVHDFQKSYDAWRTSVLALRNVSVARLTNEQALAMDADALARFVAKNKRK